MLISLDWLTEFVRLPTDLDSSALAHELTLRTVEVERIENLGDSIPEDVVVGRVLDGAGTNNDAHLVSVETGDGQMVEAWAHEKLNPSAFVAVAMSGIGGDKRQSRPVICSPADLNLGMLWYGEAAHSTLVFGTGGSGPVVGREPLLGSKIAPLLGWDDTVIEIDNKSLTNRPDLWSHYGIARELAAIYSAEFIELPSASFDSVSASSNLLDLVDPSLCRHIAILDIARRDGPQPVTPFQVRSRLARVGQRSVGFYADITNYVMFGIGQPSHAYDRAKVALPLSVRYGIHEDERALLSGDRAHIGPTTPVIADSNHAVAVAGVAGSVDTQVTDESEAVLVELANLDPRAVRRSTLELQTRTEASARFEKGLDTQGVTRAAGYIVHLLQHYDQGGSIVGYQERVVAATQPQVIDTTLSFLNDRMGTELEAERVAELLNPLGFVTRSEGARLVIAAPTWRSTGDVSIPNDILEEVSRMIGYDNLPPSAPTFTVRHSGRDPLYALERRVREFLAFRAHVQEVLTYPWASDRYLDALGLSRQPMLTIEGPPSPDRRHLRPSLLPNLLAAVEGNLSHSNRFAIFELGSVYLGGERKPLTIADERLPALPRRVGAVFVGDSLSTEFRRAAAAVTGLRRAGWIQHLELKEDGDADSWGDSVAALEVRSADRVVGRIAAIDLPRLLDIQTNQGVVAFEIELSAFTCDSYRPNMYEPTSTFPSTSIDLSMTLSNDISWASIAAAASEVEVRLVKRVEFVDEFRGDSIRDGQRSITLRLHLGAPDRTLLASDKVLVRDAIAEHLRARFAAVIRA